MKTIGIYPGNFQPPTRAHFEVYKRIRQMVGPDTFVVTTDRTPTPDAPLNIGDKEQFLVRHGVPASSVQRIQDWKHPDKIFHKFSSEHTSVIFALNQKEADEVAKRKIRSNQGLNELAISPTPKQDKEVWVEGDGKLNYFQPYKGNESSMKPFKEHGYVMIIDDSKIEDKPISTSNIRQVFGSPLYTEDGKKKFFRFVFGWFDVGLYTLISTKFKSAHQVSSNEEPSSETLPSQKSVVPSAIFKENITNLVHEILREIMDEDYSSTMSSTSDNSNDGSSMDMVTSLDKQPSLAQQRSDQAKKKQGLVKLKGQTERDLKGLNTDLDWKKSDILRKRKDEIPSKKKELNAINKQIAQPDSSTNGFN